MAWHGLETPLQVFDPVVVDDIITIFITHAVLRLIQGMKLSSYDMFLWFA